eukprot:13055351-Heterocapsa_arctica.AAC.1
MVAALPLRLLCLHHNEFAAGVGDHRWLIDPAVSPARAARRDLVAQWSFFSMVEVGELLVE